MDALAYGARNLLLLETSKGIRVDKPGTARKYMTFHPPEGLGFSPEICEEFEEPTATSFKKKQQKWPRFESRNRSLVSFGLSRAGCTGSHHLEKDQWPGYWLVSSERFMQKKHYISTLFHYILHYIYNWYITHTIHGTGIFAYTNSWCLW